jgi:predicted nucleic acid-binding protein
MNCLLDVSLLIACGWISHNEHARASKWLDHQPQFATSPGVQMGFLRVSMSPGYGATYEEARKILSLITGLPSHRFLKDSTGAKQLPENLSSRHDISDAHLVSLARSHQLKFATLDDILCRKLWAEGIAVNPLGR